MKMKNRRVKERKRQDRKSKPSRDTLSKAESDGGRKELSTQQNKDAHGSTKLGVVASSQHQEGDTPLKVQKQGARRKQRLARSMAVSNILKKTDGRLSFNNELGESQRCSPHHQTFRTTTDNTNTLMRTKACLRAVDGGPGQERGRKRTKRSREYKVFDTRGAKVAKVTENTIDLPGKISMPSTPEINRQVLSGHITRADCQSTPANVPSNRNIIDSVVISGAQSDIESTSLDRSFQLDVLNLGYSNSPKLPVSSAVKPCSAEKPDISMADSDKKMLQITTPAYSCPSNQPETGHLDNRKKKSVKGRPAKRRLCEEIRSSTGQSLLEISRPPMINMGLTRSLIWSSGPVKRDVCNSDTRIWLSFSLQIDTMGCAAHGGIKKDYNRADLVCVTHSSFRPQSTLSSYPDAVNTRVTYDRDGKVVVLEVMASIAPGIYRVIHTRLAVPHESLTRAVAMETLLVRCSAIKNLKPHSRYLVLSELHAIPSRQWREKISSTVVRLHMEDFLHTYNFHTFALPLLLWSGEKDNWSWAKKPTKKFHATRKPEASKIFTGYNKSKSAPVLTAPLVTSLQVRVANMATAFAKSIPNQSNV